VYSFEHQQGEALILDEVVNITIKYKKIVGWIVIIKEQLKKLNLGNEEDPKEVFINAILPIPSQAQIKELLVNYRDVFAWSYKKLKGITREIYEHKIELMANVQLVKQRQYRMNLNYALKVKKKIWIIIGCWIYLSHGNHSMAITFSDNT
jgi:hypothetical protein